jgi:hypothetical protein
MREFGLPGACCAERRLRPARSAEDLQAENGAASQALDRERDGLIARREYPVISLDSKGRLQGSKNGT